MDDVDGGDGARRGDRSTGGPKKKYMKILQDIADRNAFQVLIDLDDVDEVCRQEHALSYTVADLYSLVVREILGWPIHWFETC